MHPWRILIFLICTSIFYSCTQNGERHTPDTNAGQNSLVDPEKSSSIDTVLTEEKRFAWQKPDLVIQKLGSLENKVVADIGAGTGYFTFRLINRAMKVIAVDIDPNMIRFIELFRGSLDSLAQSKIETRIALPNDPNLKEKEVDVAIIINTIGYIENCKDYLMRLRTSLSDGGKLMIVDFKMKRIPGNIAPPPAYRKSILELENTLESAGYHRIVTDDTSLDYQYIILAEI